MEISRKVAPFQEDDQPASMEKLKSLNRNPVRRGLVARPGGWDWSSYRTIFNGVGGTVEIESAIPARNGGGFRAVRRTIIP